MSLAVLCARNQRNGGMYSVDLAAYQYFTGREGSFRLCRTQGATKWGVHTYFKGREWRDFDGFSGIVYWGDWQTNPFFGTNDYVSAEAKYERNTAGADALRRWRECYQLVALEPSRRPIVTIGTSFLGLDKEATDRESWNAFQTYVELSTAIIPRDPSSLSLLQKHFPSAKNIYSEGLDPAFLMSWPAAAAPNPTSKYFCYCFDRSLRKKGASLVAALKRKTGKSAVFVDWNKASFPKRLSHRKFASNIEIIRNAAFCVTDLYHLSVNALNLGVPAICFGESKDGDTVIMGEQKKKTLLASVGLPDNYIPVHNDATRAAELACGLLSAPDFEERFRECIHALDQKRRKFRDLIDHVLAGKP